MRDSYPLSPQLYLYFRDRENNDRLLKDLTNNKEAIAYKKKGGRWTIEEVNKVFNLGGAILLENSYVNTYTKMRFICKCNRQCEKCLVDFLKVPYCKQCYKDKLSATKATPYEEVKRTFEESGCILLSDSYKNSHEKLMFICNCGEKLEISFSYFKKNGRPIGCRCNLKYSPNVLTKILKEINLSYISQDGFTTTSAIYVKFKCSCGRTDTKTLNSIIISKRCNFCSHESFLEKISKENNYQWLEHKDEEERVSKRDFPEYKKWRKEVFVRDNYTCQICNETGTEINAHHLDGYHWSTERRTDVTNGITLCKNCHCEFHITYGNRNNTESQFNEFKINKIERSA